MWLGSAVSSVADRLREAFSGYCVRGTRYLLGNNDKLIPYVGSAKNLIGRLEQTGYWVRVPNNYLQPGDVVVYRKYGSSGAGAKHGHIGIYVGNGKLASDGVLPLRGGEYYVYRLTDAGRTELQKSVNVGSGFYSGVVPVGGKAPQAKTRLPAPQKKLMPQQNQASSHQAWREAISEISRQFDKFRALTGIQ